ncbi:MAG: triose-phosphate isomerase [Clostridia bacterium]|nr:triose-phosphate isomerase [Clostridia bacterium]
MERKKIIAGNWKMNMLPDEAMQFIQGLTNIAEKHSEIEIILCVPYTDLFYALMAAQNTKIKIGAQNMHWEEKGAFTGEISGKMLEPIGVEYVIIGHSERRAYFAETDETVNKKVKSALKYNLKPIICVGETLEQRLKGETDSIIRRQVKNAFEQIEEEDLKQIIIAYEPIWAIGTGKTATAQEADDTISIIRQEIQQLYSKEAAKNIIIQYGGSVNSKNAKELFEKQNIDGALIGGASLNLEEFIRIIQLV